MAVPPLKVSTLLLDNLVFHIKTSLQEVLERVKSYVLSRPEVLNDTSIWIQGMGWDQTKWPGAAFPTAVRLFHSTPSNPQFIMNL